jgi:hypothetical protein
MQGINSVPMPTVKPIVKLPRLTLCNYWEYAEAFDTAFLYEASFKDSIIILFVGMAVSEHSGMLLRTSMQAMFII